MGFSDTDRFSTSRAPSAINGFSTINEFSDIDGVSTIDGLPTTESGFLSVEVLPLVGFLGVGRLYYKLVVLCLNETNQEKGYKNAMFGCCHSFSNSSNLTCNGYTVTGEGLVELTS